MKNQAIHALVVAALGLTSVQAMATGFVTLPTSGSTAYTLCNTTGDFGANPAGSTAPTAGANNTCAIFSSPSSMGFSQKASATRNIVMNNTYTGNVNKTVGTVVDKVYFNNTTKEYIFAMRINLNSTEYATGKTFEVNDTVRTGFSGKAVSAAYRYDNQADEVLYRAGLTSTSVVADPEDDPGFDTTPDTDVAPFDTNAVDFTTDINYEDEDGSSVADSSWMYVKYTGTPTDSGLNYDAVANTLKFRQMGQEDQPYIEVQVTGYAPN